MSHNVLQRGIIEKVVFGAEVVRAMTDRVLEPAGKHGRKCRACITDNLCSPREATKAYPSAPWGDTELFKNAHRVCSFCKATFFKHGKRTPNGTVYWVRLVTAKERAYQLSQAGNKSQEEYQDKLTAGPAKTVSRGGLS